MYRAIIVTVLVAASAFAAESFNDRLAKGHALLGGGDGAGALTQYRDLQTEDPESPVLYYSMGCAQYRQGMQEVDLNAPQDALASFQEAKASFEKVLNAPDAEMRKDAAYNHANAIAQIAKQSLAARKYDEAKEAFEDAIQEYDQFLKQHPEHEGARINLDHMRYLLKSMLQNPPPPQPQQGQGENKPDQDQNKKPDQNNKQCPNPQQAQQQKDDQQKDQDKDGQSKQDQDKKDQQPQGDQKDRQPQQQPDQTQEQQQAQAMSEDEQDHQKKSIDTPQPDTQQNVDAILQSLEDVDKREQRETRNERTEIKIRKDWW